MQDIVRESIFGQALNRFSKGKLFPFPEDKPDFQIPHHFLLPHQQQQQQHTSEKSSRTLTPQTSTGTSGVTTRAPTPSLPPTAQRRESDNQTLNDVHAQEAIERNLNTQKDVLEEGQDPNLVGWYSDDDPENPQ